MRFCKVLVWSGRLESFEPITVGMQNRCRAAKKPVVGGGGLHFSSF